ncbi:MAG: endolytic transglycosylase MltG [Bacteroidales bacterium]|nr:endolytic transglycosylase MltG [Bacteroidales bacterium]
MIWCAIAAAAVVYVAVFAFNWLSDNRLPNFLRDAVIYVRPGDSADDVYAQIVREAGIRRPYSLSRSFRKKQVETYMQPGRYQMRKSYTSVYVARMLNNCWQTPARLTFSGTMRKPEQLAQKISSQMMIDSLTALRALGDAQLLAKFGFTPRNVFSLIIPDTYEMYWTADMTEVLASQKRAYDEFWTPERKAKAAALGLSQAQVSVLASIVKGETNYEPEMPKIAGVYLNRLRRHMKLQADPTVAYCYNYEITRILKKHLQVDSPYNTYRYAGLPPGPIAVPTKACLDAVLNPEGDYLYFCANSAFDGTHLFARSYSDHLRNAREFQRALNAKK